jgi:hypothetical protein
MSQNTLDPERIAQLLIADAVASLGEWARAEVLAVVVNTKANARLWLESGETLADVQRDFNRQLADHFQQDVHDEHWDTTWPVCPRHPNHPLWYDDSREAWCCQRDRVALARLGELASLGSPAPLRSAAAGKREI